LQLPVQCGESRCTGAAVNRSTDPAAGKRDERPMRASGATAGRWHHMAGKGSAPFRV